MEILWMLALYFVIWSKSDWSKGQLGSNIIYIQWPAKPVESDHSELNKLRNRIWEVLKKPPAFVISIVPGHNGRRPSSLCSICYHEVADELWNPTSSLLFQHRVMAVQETCNTVIDYWDRLTHWRYCGGEYLKRLKWAMCQCFTLL